MGKNQELFLSSILAGVCISLGCWISISSANAIIGAILFACGLLGVRILDLDLFTGKTQYISLGVDPASFYLICLIGNIIGCFLMAVLTTPAIRGAAFSIALNKANQPIQDAFVRGVACGSLMTIATYRDTPLYVSVFCVTAFILAGFNHCIADAYYMLAAKTFSVSWLATLTGNILGGAILTLPIRFHLINMSYDF